LWSNDGQLAESALVRLWVVLRRVGRNGGPASPIDPAPLEAALRAFVAADDEAGEPYCWVSEDGSEWHAEVRWPGYSPRGWGDDADATPEALGRELAAFAAWARRLAAWLRSKPAAGLPATRAGVRAQYGLVWEVTPDAEPGAAPDPARR
jgi:hypothetical protein